MKKVILSIILVVVICTQASAESSVWKAQKGESVIYMGGTCHLLRESDFPLPAEFDKAYKDSDILVFETDIGKINDLSTQQKLMAKAMYADASTIDKHLSPEVYSMLSEYCASNSISFTVLRQLKPSIIVVMLTTVELMKQGVTKEGVDMFFYKLATKDEKVVKKLETIDEQINFIVAMGEGNEDEFITHSISEMKDIKQDYEALVSAWKKGEVENLNKLMITELKTELPKLYKDLIVDRNRNWLPIIDAYHKTPEREFVLVGVGHLVGADGIIAALKKKGYKVEKL
ncbi:MAG: TraB/GumN family protein [Kiritimatiellae bacterium]|nr:TraB/GumN family protein [Kiritimatiellia bacterium]